MKQVLFIFQMILIVAGASASVIQIPTDYTTIQEGIKAAVDGDTVLIADGTYRGTGNRDINFLGKAITVMSENGPDQCIIDCEGEEFDNHRGFNLINGENSKSVINGFTIKNGFLGNQVEGGGNGAGIQCVDSSPTIINCVFYQNTARDGDGAGIYCDGGSSAVISGCVFSENEARPNYYGHAHGGGIYCQNSTLVITNCTFTGNRSAYGAGVFSKNNTVTITNCTFTGNVGISTYVGLASGGGLYCVDSISTITHSLFTENSANDGGGLYIKGTSEIVNCVFTKNTVVDHWHYAIEGGYGAGIYCGSSSATITNCTIAENVSDRDEMGGGIHIKGSSAPILTNCIFWNNEPLEIQGGVPNVSYSCIQSGFPGIGNSSKDPLFNDPTALDYHLAELSPCIDAGTDQTAPIDDFDGNSRPAGGAFDMGAYEFDDWPSLVRAYVRMPAHHFLPGDLCSVHVNIWNPGRVLLRDYPLFVILTISGELFWAPGFDGFDHYTRNFLPGLSEIQVVSEFSWPDGTGTADGIVWYAVLTNPGMTKFVGEMGVFDFGWSD